MRVWISGDSWGDFASLIRCDVFYPYTLNGRFEEQGHSVLQFARGGNGNHSQFFALQKHALNSSDVPDIWIHFWTELGRDFIHRRWTEPKESGLSAELFIEEKFKKYIANVILPIIPEKTKILFIGGQAPVPPVLIDTFKDRIDFIPDWKSEIIGQKLPYNQFMSLLTGEDYKVEMCKKWLSKKEFKRYQKLSIEQREILEKSKRFPDNAHPDVHAYDDLWNRVKERLNI